MSDEYSRNDNEFKILSNILKKNLNKRSIDSIIDKLNILKKKYPRDIRTYNFLALFYNKKNNYHQAIRVCKEGIYLFPESTNTHYIMAESFFMSNMIEEAITSYEKTISYNNNHYLSYYALGNIMKSQLKIEEAIYNFKTAINVNPKFIEAQKKYEGAKRERKNLIDYLTFFNPKKKILQPIIITNQKLQKIKYKINLNKKITDKSIVKLYQKIQQVILAEKINTECESSQIYRRNLINLNCSRHKKIFNTFNVIPEYCFGCYKIQIEPKNVLELLKLFLIFDKLNLKKNLTRKCMIELRPKIKGAYKGLIYCSGLAEAENTLKYLSPILNKTINTQIPRAIKRGCSEYALAYPEYNINPNNPQFMKYNKKWLAKEKIVDEKLKKKKPITQMPKISLSGITLKDGLIMNNWLFYAKKIGDKSFSKICKEVPHSQYIDRLLSEKL